MNWARVVVLFFTAIEAGWMIFDGSWALAVGDFITPSSGPYAGQIGPWRHIVQFLGVNPRGTPMKVVFAVYGSAWLIVGVAFALHASWAWTATLVAAVGALWFLPFGTLCSIVQIVLLLALRDRLR